MRSVIDEKLIAIDLDVPSYVHDLGQARVNWFEYPVHRRGQRDRQMHNASRLTEQRFINRNDFVAAQVLWPANIDSSTLAISGPQLLHNDPGDIIGAYEISRLGTRA